MKFSFSLGPMLMKKEKDIVKISIFKVKNPKLSFVRTIQKIIQGKFDKLRLQFVEEIV